MKKPVFRICALTKQKKEISLLFKVTKTKDGLIAVNNDNKIKGRSAYLSKSLNVIIEAQKKQILSKSLRCKVSDDIYIELIKQL